MIEQNFVRADIAMPSLYALGSPIEVLDLGDDADRYGDAVQIVPIPDVAGVVREHVTLRCGSTWERVQVGDAGVVVWVALAS